jgi:hypothetical protein
MVGYNINGCRLWSEDENKIIVSRDVIFNKKIFTKQTSIEDTFHIHKIKCPEPNNVIQDTQNNYE